MSCVYGCEDSMELWEEKDKDGKTVFGFGAYGGISALEIQMMTIPHMMTLLTISRNLWQMMPSSF